MNKAPIVILVCHITDEDDAAAFIVIDMFPKHDNPTTSVALIVADKLL